MDNRYSIQDMPGSNGAYVLERIFAQYIEETITDQQVERVISPVLAMVRQGRFEVVRRRNPFQWPYLVAATAMVVVVTVALATHVGEMGEVNLPGRNAIAETIKYISIPQTVTPLTGIELFEKAAPGYADRLEGDMRNIQLAVADTYDGGRLFGVAMMCEGNIFRFDPLPDRSYRLLALLPVDDVSFRGMEIGSLTVRGGNPYLTLNDGLENFWEGVEMRICLMGSS